MSAATFPEGYHVTAVIAHLVKPGREQGYEEWLCGIIPIADTFEGHLGINILRPKPGIQSEYIIVLRGIRVKWDGSSGKGERSPFSP